MHWGRYPPWQTLPCSVHAGIHTLPCPVHAGPLQRTVGILLECILVLTILSLSFVSLPYFGREDVILKCISFCFRYRPQGSCGQGNIFTPVCHSIHGGGLPQCMLGYHPPPGKETPLPRRPPLGRRHHPPPPRRRHPPPGRRPPPRRPPSSPTPKGEIEGDQIQAHTQGGKLRGIRSRPTPKGEIEGDQIQPPPPPQEADSGKQSMSGRYASYWNAFLFIFISIGWSLITMTCKN